MITLKVLVNESEYIGFTIEKVDNDLLTSAKRYMCWKNHWKIIGIYQI